jgi:hypothetical protein
MRRFSSDMPWVREPTLGPGLGPTSVLRLRPYFFFFLRSDLDRDTLRDRFAAPGTTTSKDAVRVRGLDVLGAGTDRMGRVRSNAPYKVSRRGKHRFGAISGGGSQAALTLDRPAGSRATGAASAWITPGSPRI